MQVYVNEVYLRNRDMDGLSYDDFFVDWNLHWYWVWPRYMNCLVDSDRVRFGHLHGVRYWVWLSNGYTFEDGHWVMFNHGYRYANWFRYWDRYWLWYRYGFRYWNDFLDCFINWYFNRYMNWMRD